MKCDKTVGFVKYSHILYAHVIVVTVLLHTDNFERAHSFTHCKALELQIAWLR